MADRKDIRVGDLVNQGALSISDGYRVRNEELGPEGIPFVRGGDIGDGWINTDTRDHIRPELANRVRSKLSQPGDAAFITKGTVGRAGRLRPEQPTVVFAPQVAYWRVLDKSVLDPGFIFYLMRSHQFQSALYGVKTHGAMAADYVSIAQQNDFRFQLPNVETQRAIAHILGTLDDKIELNRRMSETLEAVARALFKSWFVDFDPVRAKSEGRDPGLPKPLADLFPARLVDSEQGEIPMGWRVAHLGDHFALLRGLSYKGSALSDHGTPLHNLNSIYEGGGYKHDGIKFYSGEFKDRHVVLPGDVIVANTEQGHDRLLIGFAAIVPKTFGGSGIASHHLYRMRPKPASHLSRQFLVHLLNSARMHGVVSGFANGTTVNMLPPDGLEMPLTIVPSERLVETFTSLAETCNHRREGLTHESEALATLRDTLLPKLVSGELRVQDIERLSLKPAQEEASA